MKVCLLANSGFTVINFRSELIKRLIGAGNEIVVVCPKFCNLMKGRDTEFELSKLGARHIDVDFDRTGTHPVRDLRLFCDLLRVLKLEAPDVLLNYTIKASIYGSIAARCANIPATASNITGIGSILAGTSVRARFLSVVLRFQYRIALATNTVVFFQNPDDRTMFVEKKLVQEKHTCLVNGSGVDTKFFTRGPKKAKPRSFLFVGRFLKDKGILDLVEAATILKARHADICISILGDIDDNRESLSSSELKKLIQMGGVEWILPTLDVRSVLQEHEVFVLPSFREGTPKSAIEAMSMCMPLVTTNVPGCRETVINEVNGFLVPKQNPQALALAMERFIEDPTLVQRMGGESRRLVKEKYEVEKVVDTILGALSSVLPVPDVGD